MLPSSTLTEEILAGFGAEDEGVAQTPRNALLAPIVEQLERQTRSGERAQVVALVGAVREPGIYPLVGDGSIADVVALAGGYTDTAYLEQVEVRRISS